MMNVSDSTEIPKSWANWSLFPSYRACVLMEQGNVEDHQILLEVIMASHSQVNNDFALWGYFKAEKGKGAKMFAQCIARLLEGKGISSSESIAFAFVCNTFLTYYNQSTPTANAVPVKNPSVEKLLVDTHYMKGKFDIVEDFAAHIRTCIRIFQSANGNTGDGNPYKQYKGPFSALCQSSGMGKTRLSLQCAEETEDIHVIYVCLRNQHDSTYGYPPRSGRVVDYLTAIDAVQTSNFWEYFFIAIIIVYEDEVITINRDHKSRVEWLKKLVTNTNHATDHFWHNVIQEHQRLLTEKVDIQRFFAAFTSQLAAKNHCLMIVFDEAMSLTSQWPVAESNGETVTILNRIRKALRIIGVQYKLFGLFMDTNSSIGNLFPAHDEKYMTRSAREHIHIEPKLILPPYYMMPLCNLPLSAIMKTEKVELNYDIVSDEQVMMASVKVTHSLGSIALLSRPLFAMDMWENNKSIDALIIFAQRKLMDDINVCVKVVSKQIPQEETLLTHLAVLCSKYYISTTSPAYQQALVGCYMATVYGISADGQDLIMKYRSEPLLAEAATHAMFVQGAFLMLLQSLNRLAMRGVLELPSGKGEMGEMVATMVLGRAFDKASKRLLQADVGMRHRAKVYCRPIPLAEVLVELYGAEPSHPNVRQQVLALLQNNALMGAVVMFSHFIKVTEEWRMDKYMYKQLLKRGVAVLCKNGETAKDIVIPVALPVAADVPVDLWDTDTYILSFWECQVKNKQTAFNMGTLVTKMARTRTLDGATDDLFAAFLAPPPSPPQSQSSSTVQPHRDTTVPILYMTINTNANRCTDVATGRIGRKLRVSKHWIVARESEEEQSESVAQSAGLKTSAVAATTLATSCLMSQDTASSDAAASNVPTRRNKKRKYDTVKEGVDSMKEVNENDVNNVDVDDDLKDSEMFVEVAALQLCGIGNIGVFEEEEKKLLTTLLGATSDMRHLKDYYEGIRDVSAENTKERLKIIESFE